MEAEGEREGNEAGDGNKTIARDALIELAYALPIDGCATCRTEVQERYKLRTETKRTRSSIRCTSGKTRDTKGASARVVLTELD